MLVAALLFACATEPVAPPVVASGPTAHEGGAEKVAEHHEAPAAAAAPSADGWTSYGAAQTLTSAVPAADVLADPKKYANTTVRVEGKVSSVCQKAGCWLVLADDKGNQMRVTMKEHSFGVPKDVTGQLADIEGTLVEKPVDPATVEHYKSESNGGPVPEEGKTVHAEIVATGVRLRSS